MAYNDTPGVFDFKTDRELVGVSPGADDRGRVHTKIANTASEPISIAPGALDIPTGADFISSTNSANVQTVIYKAGGPTGAILKTIVITYSGCDFTAVIS